MGEGALLSFRAVATECAPGEDCALWGADFQVDPGGLLLLLVEARSPRTPLGDLVQGIRAPDHGDVLFEGVAWGARGADATLAARARIGRIFEERGFAEAWSADHNLLLAALHHTRRPLPELQEDATDLCRRFGLPGLPRGAVARMNAEDRRRMQCARLFLTRPDLLVLERPTLGLPEILPAVANGIRAARARGAGVLWITSSLEEFHDPSLRPDRRLRMVGPRLYDAERAAG